jgi:hypothetical protein
MYRIASILAEGPRRMFLEQRLLLLPPVHQRERFSGALQHDGAGTIGSVHNDTHMVETV